VVDELIRLGPSQNRTVVHYYCDALSTAKPTTDHILRAFIKQLWIHLAHLRKPIPPDVRPTIKTLFGDRVMVPVAPDDLKAIFQNLVRLASRTYYVIDGLDYLGDEDIIEVLSLLRELLGTCEQHHSKVILFSRRVLGRGINVEKHLPGTLTLELEPKFLEHDIAVFVDTEIDQRLRNREITTNSEVIDRLRKVLKAHADKMFVF
jgi:hypothetical protein